jgi:hypothetical protein
MGSIMRLTGRGYLLAALATAWAVAGCTTAGFSAAGTDKPSGATGTSPATGTQSVGSGASVTRSPVVPEWLFFPRDDSATVTTRNCPGYHAVRLLVTAPDQTTSTVFAAPGALAPVCWGFEIHPVVPGTTGQS